MSAIDEQGAVAADTVGGPYFDDLAVGDRFADTPAVTLTEGLAAAHQAITGDRLRLALDHELAREVCGTAPPAHCGLVWDVAIGQSTLATQRVRANLFYRGLFFRRFPVLGDTLRTVTEVTGLRENTRRQDRPPTGLAALRITTTDQHRRVVLDFWRCAMLPLRSGEIHTGHSDDMATVGPPAGAVVSSTQALGGWRLDRYRELVPGRHFDSFEVGQMWRVAGADVVSSAPELARLTLNIAAVHHAAPAPGGRRLVYGGHTIGLALAQVSRIIPAMVTVAGWQGCDHVGPVHEGDELTSVVTVRGKEPFPDGGGLLHLQVSVATHADGASGDVLNWRFAAVLA
jgi:acyl dehydratase